MDIELYEIRDFLTKIPPFNHVSKETINELVQHIRIRYIPRDQDLSEHSSLQAAYCVLRKGALLCQNDTGEVIDKLSEGDFCLLGKRKIKVSAVEDSLIYCIDTVELFDLLANESYAIKFLQRSSSERLRKAAVELQVDNGQRPPLLHSPVSTLATRNVHVALPSLTIQQAAQMMTQKRVSSLLIMDEDEKVQGIVTHKDMTSRCIAVNADLQAPISSIMTADLISIRGDTPAFDALLTMTRKHLHHLPVIDDGKLKGILALSDLIRSEEQNSAFLVSSVNRAKKLDDLIQCSQRIPQMQMQLVNIGADASHVGKAVTAITTAITRKLIKFAEDKFGPAPVPFAWMAAGSHARREQTSHTDQDTALIIDNAMQPEHDEWFLNLAKYVSDGLDACGYIYCPGDVMSSNPKWRLTQKQWHELFTSWIKKPQTDALLHSSIFFDMRVIHGEKSLWSDIQQDILEMTHDNTLFTAHMSASALHNRPPLGFFRDFVLIEGGDHDDTLDLKHSGIVPIVDLARLYALEAGITANNTRDRLLEAGKTEVLSAEGAENLHDAFEFISNLKVQHQTRQLQTGGQADNYMDPKELSRLERTHLKDAFKVIQLMQNTIASRLGGQLM